MPGNKPFVFTNDQAEKIGNTLVFLLQHIPQIDTAKMLQAVYLLEEASWTKYTAPFFDMPFQIWKSGPVAKDIYIDLSEAQPALLSGYISRRVEGSCTFLPTTNFNDDQFSERELELLETITGFISRKSPGELTRLLTGPYSLWYKTTVKHGALHSLQAGNLHSTGLCIDFSLLFRDEQPLAAYNSVIENREFIRRLKR